MKDRDGVWAVLDLRLSAVPIGALTIVSGDARGVDTFAKEWAESRGYAYQGYPAEWLDENGKLDRNAGFDRNHDIVNDSDFGIAFWDGVSNGTRHTISLYRKAEKPCIVHNYSIKKETSNDLTDLFE